MDMENIITNEEAMDTTEEIVKAGKSYKIAVGVGLAVLACGITYKYVVKPIVAKIKAKKQQEIDEEYESPDSYDDETESDED